MGAVNTDYFYKTPDELMGIAIGSPASMAAVEPPAGGAPPAAASEAPSAGGAPPINSAAPPAPGMMRQPGRVSYAPPPDPGAPPPMAAPIAGLPQQATTIPQDPRRAPLEQKIASASQPLNRADKQYQPKWWEKLITGLSAASYGAANPRGGDPNFGMRLGEHMRDDRYNEAEGDRMTSLKGYQTELGNVEKDEATRHEQRLENQSEYRLNLEDKRISQQDADRDEQRHQRQEEVTRSYQRVDPADGKVHTYDETRAGKTIDRGISPKDETQAETGRHNREMEKIGWANSDKKPGSKSKMGTPEQFKQAGKDKEMALAKLGDKILQQKSDYAMLPDNDLRKREAMKQLDDYRIQEEQRIERGYGDAINSLGGTYQGAPTSGPNGYHWTSAFRSNVDGKQPPETGEAGRSVEAGKGGGNVDRSPAAEPRASGNRVMVVDRKGKRFTVPESQVAEAEKQGYQRADAAPAKEKRKK